MNEKSELHPNTRQLADATETVLNTLNPQEGFGPNYVGYPPNPAVFIANEANVGGDDPGNQNEPEVMNQGQGDEPPGEVPEIELPPTAIVLHTTWGAKIYLVGTSHFSVESQEDVAKIIRAVRPNCVVLELCPSRSYMLTWDEEKLQVAKNLDFKMIKEAIHTYGVFQGAVQLLLLSLSFQVIREMGMAPGGEFRRAFREALQIPGCVAFLGDRPLEITLRRAFASMSWWQTFKFAYCVLFTRTDINKDEIEKWKNRDYLSNMLEMFGGEFPGLKEVFVTERDLYLTFSLLNASVSSSKDTHPKTVVGVVGMGHLEGIQRNWDSNKVELSEIQRVLTIPPQTKTSKVVRFILKISFYGLAFYGLHKLASRTRFYPPSLSFFI